MRDDGELRNQFEREHLMDMSGLAFQKPKDQEGKVTLSKRKCREQLERKIREQRNLCHYCVRPMNRIPGNLRCATRDHVTPQPAGCAKDDRDENIVAACFECNMNKGSQRL
jgi:hypothetical protein